MRFIADLRGVQWLKRRAIYVVPEASGVTIR
jgi:hypothetical protein